MLISQFVLLLSLPLLSRLYDPSAFAQWAIIQAVILALGAIATLRYDLSIVVEKDDKTASALFWLSTLLVTFLLVFIIIVILFLHNYDLFFFENLERFEVVFFIGCWSFSSAFLPIFNAWALRQEKFLFISLTQLLTACVCVGIQIYGGVGENGQGDEAWLIRGSALGMLSGLLFLIALSIQKKYRPDALLVVYKEIIYAARKHKRFVHFSLPFTIFGIFRDRVPILVVGHWVSNYDTGLYSQAWRLSNVPAALTGAVVRSVLFREAAKQGLGALELPINRILRIIIVLAAPLLALLVHDSERFFGWLLGGRWSEIGMLVTPLAFPAVIFSISNWMDRLLDSAQKQHINLVTEIVCSITSMSALIIMLFLEVGIYIAVTVQSIVLSLNYMLLIYMTYKVAGYRRIELLKLLLLSFLLFFSTWMTLAIYK